jgi:DNA-binding CsgD family transcriptional regulator
VSTETADERRSKAPNVPFEPVLRPRVIDRLRRAAARRIALVVAPAGFGKSVAIRQYLETDGIEHLRFSVRKEHDTLVGFLRGLVLALEPIAPKASKSVAGAYEKASRGPNPVRDLAAWVAALISRYEGTVVVDDLHFAAGDARVIELISEIVALSPDSTRWLLSMRSHLSLPYASWMAYGLMDEIVDQSALELSQDEARIAAQTAIVKFDADQVFTLLNDTKGWPAAFMFALRAAKSPTQRIGDGNPAREVLYNYLAHQVFADLSDAEKSFVIETSILSSIDGRLLEAGGLVGAQQIIQSLRIKAAFISRESEDVYRYHELFREFLEHKLAEQGDRERRSVIRKIAAICEASGQATTAVALYSKIADEAALCRILSTVGFEMFQAGHLEVLDSVSEVMCGANATTEMLILAARVKAAYGIDYEADILFRRAYTTSTTFDEQGLVAWRHATYLSRRQRLTQAQEIVSRVAIERIESVGLRGLLLGIHASILSCLDQMPNALAILEQSLSCLSEIQDDATRNTLLSYGSFVQLKAQRLELARDMATKCLEGALRSANYELAVIACTQLYNIALDQEDGRLADRTLETMLSSSSRSGDLRMRGIALMNMVDRAGMRGDENELEGLVEVVTGFRDSDPKTWSECVSPTLAIREAWKGNCIEAIAILSEGSVSEFDGNQRALRFAELALYASCPREPKLNQSAVKYLQSATAFAAKSPDMFSVRHRRAMLLINIVRGLLEKDATGLRIAQALVDNDQGHVSGKVSYSRIGGDSGDLRLVQEFRTADYAGWRRAISAVIGDFLTPKAGLLTKTELEVVKLISKGHTSREVAELINRSVLTVDTHVKAIVRKLGVKNRRAAIRRAADLGIL